MRPSSDSETSPGFVTEESLTITTLKKDSMYAELKPDVYLSMFSVLALSLLAVVINIGTCLKRCKCQVCDHSSTIKIEKESGTRRDNNEVLEITPQKMPSPRQVERSCQETGWPEHEPMCILQPNDVDYTVLNLEDTYEADTTAGESVDDLTQNFIRDKENEFVSKQGERNVHALGNCSQSTSLSDGNNSYRHRYENTDANYKSDMYCSMEDLNETLSKDCDAHSGDTLNFPTENRQLHCISLYSENFDETVTDGDFVPIRESIQQGYHILESTCAFSSRGCNNGSESSYDNISHSGNND